MPEAWEELLAFMQQNVSEGNVTTYGNLSAVYFGGSGSAPAIVAMLSAAGNNDSSNCLWTNRVVNAQGKIQVEGQLEQLLKEGVPIRKNGTVDFKQLPPLIWNDDAVEEEGGEEQGREPDQQRGTVSAFVVFQDIIDQETPGTEELQKILRNIQYGDRSFANDIKNHLEERLNTFLSQVSMDLFTLLRIAQESQVLVDNAIDLAHTIRKQRNYIIHNAVPAATYFSRNRLVLMAAFLLWPQLPD